MRRADSHRYVRFRFVVGQDTAIKAINSVQSVLITLIEPTEDLLIPFDNIAKSNLVYEPGKRL